MRINIFEGILIPFVGFWIGILFLLALDHLIPHFHVGSDQAEAEKNEEMRMQDEKGTVIGEKA